MAHAPGISGRVLGHYTAQEKIGEGGMGEVYRARDSRLGRDVALKVLPASFAGDPERLARLEREAQLLATLNHPNIATVYGLDEDQGTRFLAMELVEGETLADRIARGPLSLAETAEIGLQIAEALEAAHERGIIHRDLKPANVKLTPGGRVKVLDFGLAKVLLPEVFSGDPSSSPTITLGSSREGTILGTAAYMSPEQARGKAVDRRADIWSFGCVLYEALTGQPPFTGETTSDVLARVLEREPDLALLPSTTPQRLRLLIRRCLEKNPARRLQHMGDARLELEESVKEAEVPAAAAPGARKRAWALAAGVALLAALAAFAAGWMLRRTEAPPQMMVQFTVVPEGAFNVTRASRMPPIGLSPDGNVLAFNAWGSSGSSIWIRPLNELTAQPVAGTESSIREAMAPFFSPDGQWVGYFSLGKLFITQLGSGSQQPLADAALPRGAVWTDDGWIVYSPRREGALTRVRPASGSRPEALAELDQARGDRSHSFPSVLPGGDLLLTLETADGTHVAVFSMTTRQTRVLLRNAQQPHYVEGGYLVFVRGEDIYAAPFDIAKQQVTGPEVGVVRGVLLSSVTGAAHFDVSRSGVVAYLPRSQEISDRQLLWLPVQGAAQALRVPLRGYEQPRLSPDGRKVVVVTRTANADLWVHDVQRGTFSRLTFDTGEDETPVWTPDSRRVIWSADRDGKRLLLARAADGSGNEEILLEPGVHAHVASVSPDGRHLLWIRQDPVTGWDLYVLPLEGERKPRPWLVTPFNENWPAFSPDGRWVAYSSDEGGRPEVYVQAFEGGGGKWQISAEGGEEAVWAPDGRRLYYRRGQRLMAVDVTLAPAFSASVPRAVSHEPFDAGLLGRPNYDPAQDGRLLVVRSSHEDKTEIHVLLNWQEQLRRSAQK